MAAPQAHEATTSTTTATAATAVATTNKTVDTSTTATTTDQTLTYSTPYQQQLQTQLPAMKWFILILALQMTMSSIGMDIFMPAIQGMSQDLSLSYHQIQTFITYLMIGVGLGQLFWGPFCDRFGRRTTIWVTSICSFISCLLFIFFQQYCMLVGLRILQGFMFAGIGIVPTVVLRDLYSPKQYIIYNTMMISLFMFAPMISPLIGGYIYIWWGWQMIFVALAFMFLVSLLLYIKFVPETLNPASRQAFTLRPILLNFRQILASPKSRLLLAINSVYSLTFMGVVTLLPNILINVYHVAPDHFGYYYAALIVVVIVGLQVNQLVIGLGYNPLIVVMVSASLQVLLLSLNLGITFNWLGSSLGALSITVVIGVNVLFNGTQLSNMLSFYVYDYPKITGTAISLQVSLRFIFSGVLLSFVSYADVAGGANLMYVMIGSLATSFSLTLYYFVRFTKCGKYIMGNAPV